MINKKENFLKETTDSRSYKIVMMKNYYDYCYICQRREGSYDAACCPAKVYGYHGNHKRVYSTNYRSYRSWKHQRQTQYK